MDCKEDPGGSIYAEVGEGLLLGEGAGYLSTFAGTSHSPFQGDHNQYQVSSCNISSWSLHRNVFSMSWKLLVCMWSPYFPGPVYQIDHCLSLFFIDRTLKGQAPLGTDPLLIFADFKNFSAYCRLIILHWYPDSYENYASIIKTGQGSQRLCKNLILNLVHCTF